MKIITMIHIDDLRNLCIDNNYFTCGDNRAYLTMLHMFEEKSLSGDDIATLASTIKVFSITRDSIEEIAKKVFAVCTNFLSIDNG